MNSAVLSGEEVERIRRWRLHRFQARLARLLLGLWLLAGGGVLLHPYVELGWNITESLPGRVFLIVKTQRPVLGQPVAFYPPRNPYYPPSMYFTKLLVGGPGDVISHRGRDVFLNGRRLGTALAFDSRGRRRLAMIPDGVIPPGHHFVWTPHAHSYDSRYAEIGLVSDAQILGRAYRLL